MLDRFDARWMLDLSDFKKGGGSTAPVKLLDEVNVRMLQLYGQPSMQKI